MSVWMCGSGQKAELSLIFSSMLPPPSQTSLDVIVLSSSEAAPSSFSFSSKSFAPNFSSFSHAPPTPAFSSFSFFQPSFVDFHSSDLNQARVFLRADMDVTGVMPDAFEAAESGFTAAFAEVLDVLDVTPADVRVVSVTPLLQPAVVRALQEAGVNVIVEVATVASVVASMTSLLWGAFENGTLVQVLKTHGLDVAVTLNAVVVEETPYATADDDDGTGPGPGVDMGERAGSSTSPAVVIVSVTGAFFGSAAIVVLYLLKRRRTRIGLISIVP